MSTSARRRNSGSTSTSSSLSTSKTTVTTSSSSSSRNTGLPSTSMTAAAARRRSSNDESNNASSDVVVPRVTTPTIGRRRLSGNTDTSRLLGILREDEEIASTITTRSRAVVQAQQQTQQTQQTQQAAAAAAAPASNDAWTPPRDGFTLLADRKRDEQRRKLEEDLKLFSMNSRSNGHKCPKCSKPVYAKEANSFDGVLYHKLCSTCDGKGGKCRASLVPAVGTCHQGKIFCQFCLQREEGIVGFGPAYHATRKNSFY